LNSNPLRFNKFTTGSFRYDKAVVQQITALTTDKVNVGGLNAMDKFNP